MNVFTLLEALTVCKCSIDANRMASMIQSILQSNQSVLDSIPAAWIFSALRSTVRNLQAKPMHDVLTLFQAALIAYETKNTSTKDSTKEKIM